MSDFDADAILKGKPEVDWREVEVAYRDAARDPALVEVVVTGRNGQEFRIRLEIPEGDQGGFSTDTDVEWMGQEDRLVNPRALVLPTKHRYTFDVTVQHQYGGAELSYLSRNI
jgi:hypothetical protein